MLEFFSRKNIQLSQEAALELTDVLGGLPLALELLAASVDDAPLEEELIARAREAKESVVEYLFAEVYTRLSTEERDLLITASLLKLPYKKPELLGAQKALTGRNCSEEFNRLKRQSLIKPLGTNTFHVHEVISSLALEHADIDLGVRRRALAEYLMEDESNDPVSQLEAFLLLIHENDFDRAAEVATDMMAREFLRSSPNLAETMMGAFTEDKVNPDWWVWILGNKGTIAAFWRRYDEAETLYRQMLEFAEKIGNKSASAIALLRLGIIYADQDDKIAESYYLDSLALQEELGDLKGQADVCNNLGLIYSERGDFDRARAVLERGLELHRRLDSPNWLTLSLNSNLGILYARQGQWDKALEYSRAALRIAEEIKSPYDIAKTTYNIGRHEAYMGDVESARVKYLRVLETAERYDLWELEELACVALGRFYHDVKEYDRAIEYFRRVAAVRERVEDYEGLAPIYFDLGTLHSLKDDPDAAIGFYEKGLSIFEHITDERLIDLYLRDVENLALQHGRPEIGRRLVGALRKLKRRLASKGVSYPMAKLYGAIGGIYLDTLHREGVGLSCLCREKDILGEIGRARDQAESLINLGVAYQGLSHYGDALRTNQEALGIAETHKFTDLKGNILFNTANCYMSLDRYLEAEKNYRSALEVATELDDHRLVHLVQFNLGEALRRQNRHDDAITLLRSSLKFNLEQGDYSGAVMALNNIGLAYVNLSQSDQALENFNEAVTLARAHSLHSEEANTLISLGNYYLRNDDPSTAKSYYEQALSAARNSGDIDMEEGAMLSLALAHRELGTTSEIEDDFKVVMERANRLEHHENLTKLLALAGEVNLDEGEIEHAAEAFEKALFFAYLSALISLKHLGSHDRKHFRFHDLFQVIARIAESLDLAIEEDRAGVAKEFYHELISKVRSGKHWAGDSFVLRYLLPIGGYLNELPSGPVLNYIADAWKCFPADDDSEGSAEHHA